MTQSDSYSVADRVAASRDKRIEALEASRERVAQILLGLVEQPDRLGLVDYKRLVAALYGMDDDAIG